jgi:hypothetical protein
LVEAVLLVVIMEATQSSVPYLQLAVDMAEVIPGVEQLAVAQEEALDQTLLVVQEPLDKDITVVVTLVATLELRGGGGGGGGFDGGATGSGGSGGGGNGGYSANGSAGTANTGGGGGGTGAWNTGTGRAGGSGVVIIRYLETFPAASSTTGSPTITTTGGYRIYTFNASGSITF